MIAPPILHVDRTRVTYTGRFCAKHTLNDRSAEYDNYVTVVSEVSHKVKNDSSLNILAVPFTSTALVVVQSDFTHCLHHDFQESSRSASGPSCNYPIYW